MDISNNIAAQTAATDLNTSNTMLNASLARLSSGSQIVNPSDNPAGLAESLYLAADVNQTNAANGNVSNAISFLQTQDGYLQQVGTALDQMAQLAVQSQDVTLTDTQRADYQQEFSTLAGYITDTATKDFNGVSLFSGNALAVTTDGNGDTFSMTGISLNGASTAYYAVTDGVNNTPSSTVSVATTTGAVAALNLVQAAISQLGTDSATVGANEQRLNYTSSELGVLTNNLTAANSQISDVNVATESTNYAKFQILVQSGVSMLAQANANSQAALKLLQ
jgi:flagellin